MRPRQINVFDGLRITTEHLDHLQGAFLTGLQDLREASGLGRVVRGFEVTAEGDGRVAVQAGLAFDREKNRIVSDEPRTLDADFREGAEELWVTVRYDQQESGEVEGRQTLIWDGCALELVATRPGPQALAIAIARLWRGEDGGLVVGGPDEPPPAAEGEGPPPPAPGEPPPAAGERGGTSGGAAPGPSVPASAPAQPRLAAAQGMLRFASPASPFGSPLPALAAAARGQAGQPAETQPDPSLTLATGDLSLPFAPLSLSCQVVLLAGPPEGQAGGGAAPSAPLQSTSWGEATLGGETLAQHALTQCPACGQASPAPRSLMAQGVVAQLPLGPWADAAGEGESGPADPGPAAALAACRYLQLSVRAARREPQGLQLILTLDWKGGYEEDRIRLLEAATVRFPTEALLTWKALGLG